MWSPPPNLPGSEWADQYRIISAPSPQPGKWDTNTAPYQREILNCISDRRVERIVCMMSSQVGKTEILNNAIGYFIHLDPCSMLVFQPSDGKAKEYSKERIAPMIRDTAVLKERVFRAKSRASGNTLLWKSFPGGFLALSGANSPSAVASKPIRFLAMDEVDRYNESAGTEGDPVSLAIKRTANFHNRKLLFVSTPGNKGESRIEDLWLESDMRRYHIPCPHCNEMIDLKFGQIRWDEGKPETALYECQKCTALFDDKRKLEYLQKGKWIAEKPFKKTAGFHLNELYSPWRKWAEVVEDFLKKRNKPEDLKTFVNTSLGETWEVKGEAPDWERLYDRREQYTIGTVPKGVYLLTAGCDVQQNRIEIEVIGWGKNLESWSIQHKVFYGDTSTNEPWDELAEYIGTLFPGHDGMEFPISMVAVDSQFNTQHVYNWVRKFTPDRVVAIKGRDKMATIVGRPHLVDVTFMGQTIKDGCSYWPVGVSLLKSEVYGFLKNRKTKDGSLPYGFCHFPEHEEEYFKQLTAESLVFTKKAKGSARYEWKKNRERNEILDCRVYARAAAHIFGIDRFEDHHWDEVMGAMIAASKIRKKSEVQASTEAETPRKKTGYL